MARLIAYLRVSTERQARDGFGLDIQQATIRSWARQHGHRIVAWVQDAGVSGALDDRAGLAEAFEGLRGQVASGIVVARLDRLARDLIVQESLLAEVWRGGWQAHSATPGEAHLLTDDPGDPSRTLIRQVLGAVSQYERALIRLRLAGGRARKAASGGYAYGAPPYGSRSDGRGSLVPDDAETAVLNRMRTDRAGGASLRQIAARLNGDGVKPRRGDVWHPQTVARALTRLRC